MPGEGRSAKANTSEYLFRGIRLIARIYYVFLIQGEISFLVRGRLYLTPFSFPPKVQLGLQTSHCQSTGLMFSTERESTCHSSVLYQPEAAGKAAPLQCLLWQGDNQRTPLLEFPGGLTSLVSVFSL